MGTNYQKRTDNFHEKGNRLIRISKSKPTVGESLDYLVSATQRADRGVAAYAGYLLTVQTFKDFITRRPSPDDLISQHTVSEHLKYLRKFRAYIKKSLDNHPDTRKVVVSSIKWQAIGCYIRGNHGDDERAERYIARAMKHGSKSAERCQQQIKAVLNPTEVEFNPDASESGEIHERPDNSTIPLKKRMIKRYESDSVSERDRSPVRQVDKMWLHKPREYPAAAKCIKVLVQTRSEKTLCVKQINCYANTKTSSYAYIIKYAKQELRSCVINCIIDTSLTTHISDLSDQLLVKLALYKFNYDGRSESLVALMEVLMNIDPNLCQAVIVSVLVADPQVGNYLYTLKREYSWNIHEHINRRRKGSLKVICNTARAWHKELNAVFKNPSFLNELGMRHVISMRREVDAAIHRYKISV